MLTWSIPSQSRSNLCFFPATFLHVDCLFHPPSLFPSFFPLFLQHLLNSWVPTRHHAKLEKTREMSNLSSRSSQFDTNYCWQCNEGCAPGGWGARLRKGEEGTFNCLKGYSGQTISCHSLTTLISCFLPLRLLGVFLQVRLLFNTVFQSHLLWVTIQLDVCFLVHTSVTAHITLWSRYCLSACLSDWIVMSSKEK